MSMSKTNDDNVVSLWPVRISLVERQAQDYARLMLRHRQKISEIVSMLTRGLSELERAPSGGVAEDARNKRKQLERLRAELDDLFVRLSDLDQAIMG